MGIILPGKLHKKDFRKINPQDTQAGRFQRQENQVYYHTCMSENDRALN